MALFDFVTVMVSMILALSLGHLPDGISHRYRVQDPRTSQLAFAAYAMDDLSRAHPDQSFGGRYGTSTVWPALQAAE